MTRRIPAQYQYASIAARRHPLRDRNKHRLAWGEWDWAMKNFEKAAVAAAGAFMQLADSIPTHI